ncbi:hypothetical protein FOPG_11227 [Fusarium oxysporum f. sp. conglutinans race 2 54008]|uniref:Amino acid permease/ SLC12A domain-containing protein n=3 Tax=Fusarium oxysporum f. sp. conglutinans TaxID=100902 RepID=F9G2Y5_FUSOF|nr:hypothetical protein FOXB_13017 [Fusarium oxysporum f. sp. conglutinans Fo5176]EXL73417.1 hypothetical protein FOPG_11227 [Fusarium oxysporum f. sp. conglutinans race 2 54008]KAI8413986.1 hypothetical protein FOFC_07277 [Fusarium oxysporum]
MEQTPSSPDIVQDINKKEDGSTYQERVSISNGQMSDNMAPNTDMETAIQHSVNHRKLNSRQIQLFAVAGAIGNTLFVSIGKGLLAGPLALLVGFLLWGSVIFCMAQCQIEIVSLLPIDGAPIRLAGRMIDPAVGVAAGWNYFFVMISYVMFEATIINTIVTYWGYDQSPAILISATLLFFFLINVYRVDLFGEFEFWVAFVKILLAIGLMLFTLTVMLGGNPMHDRFGFRYWQNPGPWAGNTAPTRLQSFVNGVNVAGYCIGGPEYLSMVAGESKDPRRVIPRAFRTIIYRLIIFCIGGCICVGILVPSNDPKLTAGTGGFAGGSPYVISMQRLNIPIMPSIVTCCLLTFVVSGGINFTFNASRALHALALDGQAPKFLRRLNRHGVPDMAVIVVILLSCLAYLALGSGSAKVLNWLLNFSTASAMFYWTIMSMTWIRFNSAMKAQGIDRKTFLPTVSRWQPFAGYWAFGWSFLFLWVQGYAVFLHGNWQVSTFIFNYGIIAFATVIGIIWKLVKRTRFHRSKEIDLHSGLDFFEALSDHYRREREGVPQNLKDKVLAKLF